MSEEISTKNRFLHLSNDEDPREGSAEAKVEGERSFAVRTDRSVVHCHKGELVWQVLAVRGRRRYGAHFRPCVYQKACPCVSVTYVKKATEIWAGSTRRR